MKCTTCGTELEPGAAFCANCGTRAPAASVGSPTILITNPYDPEVDEPTVTGPVTQPAPASSAPQNPGPQTVVGGYSPQPLPAGTYTPQPYVGATENKNSTMAIVSLVFGILGLIQVLPFIGAVVAVIAGHLARREIRASGGSIGGAGLAMAGLIMGYLMLALWAVACVAFVALLALGTFASFGP